MQKVAKVKPVRKELSKAFLASHGRYIYAYCHVRTNQVVYSLQRVLKNNDALRQLPDLGANNKDAALRKDLWRPLFTVIFPATPSGLKQGLYAYQKLREWRRLHETSWTPSPLLKRPYSEEEIEHLNERLEDRGGSKKETVWDIIKRQKKKLRVRTVQDQKANSVADLAAVLLEQGELGAQTEKKKVEELRADRKREIEMMLKLADEAADANKVALLDREIEQLEKLLKGEAASESEETVSRTKAKRQLAGLRVQKRKMDFALAAVAKARIKYEELDPSTSERALRLDQGRQHATEAEPPRQPPSAQSLQQEPANETSQHPHTETSTSSSGLDWHSMLPSFPHRRQSSLPKRGWLANKIRRLKSPIFTTQDVSIRWADILDAEYAEEWPEAVQHERMGLARHVAPDPEEEAIHDVGEFRLKSARMKKKVARTAAAKNRELNERNREKLLESVKSRILTRVQEKELARRARERKGVLLSRSRSPSPSQQAGGTQLEV